MLSKNHSRLAMILRKNAFTRQLILLSSAMLISISAMATGLNQTQTLAKKGDALAQNNLGMMYVEGKGVPQDYAVAKEWFAKSANQGNALAQYYLGMMYYNSKGVTQNYAIAKEWFGKACDNGFQHGCDNYKTLNFGPVLDH